MHALRMVYLSSSESGVNNKDCLLTHFGSISQFPVQTGADPDPRSVHVVQGATSPYRLQHRWHAAPYCCTIYIYCCILHLHIVILPQIIRNSHSPPSSPYTCILTAMHLFSNACVHPFRHVCLCTSFACVASDRSSHNCEHVLSSSSSCVL